MEVNILEHILNKAKQNKICIKKIIFMFFFFGSINFLNTSEDKKNGSTIIIIECFKTEDNQFLWKSC